MTSTIIRNGRIVTAVDDYVADILVEDGRVAAIGRSLEIGGHVEAHDASGLLVLPGGVDCHTHLENTFGASTTADTYETGTKAAAFGGTTTVVDFAFQRKDRSIRAAIERVQGVAETQASVDYGLHVITTHVDDQTLEDMRSAIRHEGVTSFKMFMAYPGIVMVDDAAIFRAMRLAGQHGAMVCLHAENGIVIEQLIKEALAAGHRAPKYHGMTRPSLMEGEATHRGIKLAELAEAPVYFVHLSAKEALAEVVQARSHGIPVFAETCPHYLFLDESAYSDESFEVAKFVMTPPLRSKEAQAALWRALRFDQLQVVSTDHCPFCMKEGHLGRVNQKPFGRDDFSKIPNGAPGLETRLTVLYDGGVRGNRLSLNRFRFVELASTAPAKIFGLFPRKGTIAVGSDADIVLFDENERHVLSAKTHHSAVDYSLFEGKVVQGRVKKVFLRGEVVVDGERWLGRAGAGRFQKRGEVQLF
jgi:dihydropyrimidinase